MPTREQIHTNVPPRTKRGIEHLAQLRDCSQADVIMDLVSAELARCDITLPDQAEQPSDMTE